MKSRLAIWTHAIRPRTLAISICPVIIGSTLALTDGYFDFPIFLSTIFASLFIQIGTNLANDYFDFINGADTAEHKGPLKVTQAGLVSHLAMKCAICLTFGLSALFGAYLIWEGGAAIALIQVLAILFGILYTAGPKPLGYIGLGDPLVFIFFGPIAVAGSYFLQTHALRLDAILAGISTGAFSIALIGVCNLRDMEEDAKIGKKTLQVRFGRRFGKYEYLVAMLMVFIVPLFFVHERPFALITEALVPLAIRQSRHVFIHDEPKEMLAMLPKTARLLILYTLLFCTGWML
ncbi:MAG: 1,4-dihydroxy-2-naphthoate polyprenyltransferase [Anaerolineae bacterium]